MGRRVSTIGGLPIRLAEWLAPNERYQRRYLEVVPQSESLSGDVAGLVADAKFRPWVVRSWERGEGFDVWSRDQHGYRQADGVRPHPTDDGLILSFDAEIAQGQSGNFGDGGVFGYAGGTVYTGDDSDIYGFSINTKVFLAARATGGGTSDIASIGYDANQVHTLTGHQNKTIRRHNGGNSQVYGTGTGDDFTNFPLLVTWGSRVFALDGVELYELDITTTNTRTLVGDPDLGAPSGSLNFPQSISLSDVGPIWLVQDHLGQTKIYEYNVASDTQRVVAALPARFLVTPSIFFAKGFYWVSYHTSPTFQAGKAFLFAVQGNQQSILGPFRTTDDDALPIILGVIGSEILIGLSDRIWAYDLDSGGIVHYGDDIGIIEGGVIVADAVLTNIQSSFQVGMTDGTQYQTSGTIHLGWHDWDYPGLLKTFLDLEVITAPLPANTTVTAAVAVDGSTTYTALSGTHQTDNATRFKFTVTNPTSAPIIGKRFEVRLTLTGSGSNTPTILEVSGRATGVESILEIAMQIDCGTADRQVDHVLLAALNALKTTQTPVTFSDVFQKRERDAPDSFVVTVQNVVTPSIEQAQKDQTPPSALLEVRVMNLV
jgi:hypothetical protein